MRASGWRRALVLGVVAAALAVVVPACSSGDDQPVQAGAPEQDGGSLAVVRQVLDARLVAGGLGWATTPGGLFVSEDAGSTWRRWNLPGRAESVLAVALLGPRHGVIASNTGTGIAVSSSTNGGGTWQTAALRTDVEPTHAEFAYDGRGVVGLLAQRASSSNFSMADWYAADDGGRSWTRHDAPAAGKVSLAGDGTLWLAGGPARNQLFRSTDGGASWRSVALPRSVAARPVAVDPPVTRPDGLTVLAVTVPGADKASVVAFTSRDKGGTWRKAARTELPVAAGSGVALPTSLGPADTLVVAAPDGSAVVRVPLLGGAARSLVPRGLRKGVVAVTLTDTQLGWATFTASSCQADKTDCTSRTGLLVTRNGGETWQGARLPSA